MGNLRTHGAPPFEAALLHGGPGAAGEMHPVACELARERGVLEPLQTADSVDGQVQELRAVLEEHAAHPAILVGYSWGAWLGILLASRHPRLARKLILVSSGGFREEDGTLTLTNRILRLHPEERAEAESLLRRLADPVAFARFGTLLSRADAFDPLEEEGDAVDLRADIFRKVWAEAAELRRSGALLEAAGRVGCPVVAIHGDRDPHPADGVREPLARVLPDFRFVLLPRCGHKPWAERQARDRFYGILRAELGPRG